MRDVRHAVVGAGGIGSAATYWISRAAGGDVLCLEQWEPGHRRGASEDHSRIIRLGYHAERYTALTRDAYAAWRAVEEESGLPLITVTGALNVGRPGTEGGDILDAYEDAMRAHALPYERLDGAEVAARWPQFRIPEGFEGIVQPDGGILDIRRGGAALRALARARGATVLGGAQVTGIHPRASGVELETTAGPVRAQTVTLCAGAWTRDLLARMGLDWRIRLTREQVTYFATPNLRAFAPDRFPVWIWHGEGDEEYYGFPVYGEVATKAAQDLGGPEVGLTASSWEPDPARVEKVADFLDGILPGYAGPELYTRCCLYDMPPDRDFVIDHLPGEPRIGVCVGAGHAAKFASLLGRILAELATAGETRFPIEPFAADRPALADPGYAPAYRLGGGAGTSNRGLPSSSSTASIAPAAGER